MYSSPFRLRVLALACTLLPLAVQAASSGSCTYEDKKLMLTDGVVYQEPDTSEEGKKVTTVALASVKLDAGRIAAAENHNSAVTDQVSDQFHGQSSGPQLGLIRITFGTEGVTGYYTYIAPGTNMSQYGSAPIGELKLSRNDAKGAAGHYTLKGEVSCDFTFDLAYAAPNAKGTGTAASAGGKPIPAGGGDAGKVFQANVVAMQKGDIDAMLVTVSKDQAEQMRAQRKDPEFPAMLEMMKAFAPRSVKVTGGQDFGDHAELTLEGIDQGGGKSTGTAQMVKEDGKWKVQKTSMKSGG
jgi:hypothetical protein